MIPGRQAQALSHLGTLHHRAGRYPEAYAAFQRSLTMWDALGDNFGRADVSEQLAIAADMMGDKRSSASFAKTALALWPLLRDRRALAESLYQEFRAADRQQKHQEAVNVLRRVLALREQLGDQAIIA